MNRKKRTFMIGLVIAIFIATWIIRIIDLIVPDLLGPALSKWIDSLFGQNAYAVVSLILIIVLIVQTVYDILHRNDSTAKNQKSLTSRSTGPRARGASGVIGKGD